MVISYRRFGTSYRSRLQGSTLGWDRQVDHYSLRNNPEERSSQLLSGGSLKSRIVMHFSCVPRMLHDHPPNIILFYFLTQLIFVQSVQ
jgi:hypothetical protein